MILSIHAVPTQRLRTLELKLASSFYCHTSTQFCWDYLFLSFSPPYFILLEIIILGCIISLALNKGYNSHDMHMIQQIPSIYIYYIYLKLTIFWFTLYTEPNQKLWFICYHLEYNQIVDFQIFPNYITLIWFHSVHNWNQYLSLKRFTC